MQVPNIEAEISSDGGLLFQTDATWPNTRLEAPINTTPVKSMTARNAVHDDHQVIADVYHDISSGDLEELREGAVSETEARIKEDFRYDDEFDVVVLFLEYDETKQMPREDMNSLIELQHEHADILTMPLQPKATNAIRSDREVTAGWDMEEPPWRGYKSSVETFLDVAQDYDEPAMATLSSMSFSRLQELARTFIGSGVHMFAYDWRSCKPSDTDNHDGIRSLLQHLIDRGEARDQVFYSLNHPNYIASGDEEFYPAEALGLVGMGFDIVGGRFRPIGGGGGSSSESMKVFDPMEFVYVDVPNDAEPEDYPVNPSIDLTQIAEASDSKNRNLRRLINAEGLSIGLTMLRAALQDGNERTYLENLDGYTGSVKEAMESFATAYNDATGRSPSDFSSP